MRKRLIQKFTKSKEGTLGYTLTEMLVVIAIIAILVAIAIPSVVAISRALKFKRLNDHAKSIFMAAQQNLSEMRSDGELSRLQKGKIDAEHADAYEAIGAHIIPEDVVPNELKPYTDEYVYTFTGEDVFKLILPAGSVDATVLSEDIVIEYNPFTGNVYSVFYSEEEDIANEAAYEAGLPREKSERKERMLGYYNGSPLNSSTIDELTAQAEISFIDGEEGIVQVRIPVHKAFYSRVDQFAQALTVDLTLTGEYSQKLAQQNPDPNADPEADPTEAYTIKLRIKDTTSGLTGKTVTNEQGATCYSYQGNTIVLEYVIDSLVRCGSFANYSAGTYLDSEDPQPLTTLSDESQFKILPGENVTIQVDATVDMEITEIPVEVESATAIGVNPMFQFLSIDSKTGSATLKISNGRHLQNLNAIAPTLADMVTEVLFEDDIYWNETVAYYNNKYGEGETYHNRTPIRNEGNEITGYAYDEAPARALPYFVPIHNAYLFGTAEFIYPGDGDHQYGGWLNILQGIVTSLKEILLGYFDNANVPSLTDELDSVRWKLIAQNNPQAPQYATSHAAIQGQNHKVYNLNINTNLYTPLTSKFYTDADYVIEGYNFKQTVDYRFTGLFGYVNTSIRDLRVVNPIVKGRVIEGNSNPATGALVGAAGWNTLLTNCGVYIDKLAPGYNPAYLTQRYFDANNAQDWYGVSGHGAVGGLVGYAKSHHSVTTDLDHEIVGLKPGEEGKVLSFSKCFAAVPVSGVMRSTTSVDNKTKDFGYSNGVGGFIGNSQLTNFYACYASGNVYATNCYVTGKAPGSGSFTWDDIGDWIASGFVDLFGGEMQVTYEGRTSWGAGGFAGTSHGTRYTNCFATGNVTATAANGGCGAGGFVGFMSIDETSAYGNTVKKKDEHGNVVEIGKAKDQIRQRTVFTNCYAVGQATTNGTNYENFSGANGRIVFDMEEFGSYVIGDYYRLYAPYRWQHRYEEDPTPQYGKSTYIFRDTYYLEYGRGGDQDASRSCAESTDYGVLQNLHIWNNNTDNDYGSWANAKLNSIKQTTVWRLKWPPNSTYQAEYFKYDYMDNEYMAEFQEAYPSTYWERATSENTHPYTVASGGAAYPFSKLKDMDYYGDWPAEPSNVGIAYYEIYEQDVIEDTKHYILDKEYTAHNNTCLKNGEDDIVVQDGYSILSGTLEEELNVMIYPDPNRTNGVPFVLTDPEPVSIDGKPFYAYALPDEALEIQPKDGEFYLTASASVTEKINNKNQTVTYWMYFNPNVALSHVSPMDGAKDPGMPKSAPKLLYVRSARQFKGLSNLDDFLGEGTHYVQEMNIDAEKYGDYCDWKPADQKLNSIGSPEQPFNGTYSAGYTAQNGTAKRYSVSGFQLNKNAEGIFAAVGSEGSIENLVVNTGAITSDDDSVADAAVLAGRNEGWIYNVDLTADGTIDLTAQNNAGVLVGYNSGTVRNCEVSAAAVNLTAQNCGGLIGSAVGITKTETVEGESVQVTENAVVTDCKLTLTSELSMTGKMPANATAGNTFAGGLIGYGEDLTLSVGEPAVSLTSVTAEADFAGGLAGYLGETNISVADSSDAPVVQITGTLSNDTGYAAGFLGKGENVTTIGMNVVANSVSGAQAAGFLGTGTGMDVSNSNVVIGTAITGDSEAAGVACTIGGNCDFENVSVALADVTVSATDDDGKAAGYAVEITANTGVRSGVVTLSDKDETSGEGAKISGGAYAAGYAYSIGGYVGRYNSSNIDPAVMGKGAISAQNAAGFACQITGQVQYASVSPARDLGDYEDNSNGNLTVTGVVAAAGFALDVNTTGVVDGCCSLNAVAAPKASGFVITNKGTIQSATSNVTITGGHAFIEKNEGTVRRCYGWYGDGKQTTTVATVDGCISSYFADLDPVDPEGVIAVLYPADGGAPVNMTAKELQESINMLSDASNRWFDGGYDEYPYAKKLQDKEYLYPMVDDHLGDWFVPPQYAFGLAYYETYQVDSKEMMKIHMVDLSDHTETEEGVDISTFLLVDGQTVTVNPDDAFKNEGVIQTTGYAVFGKKNQTMLQDVQSEDFLFAHTLKHEQSVKTVEVEYDFYKLDTSSADQYGEIEFESKFLPEGTSATVNVYFADAINANGTYYVRTPEQLEKTNTVKANFIQSHDIAVTDFTNMTLDSSYTYEGKYDSTLSVSQQTITWMTEVAGTVKTMNIQVTGGVNMPIFRTVTGSVSLDGLAMDTVAEGGAVAETVGENGSVTVPGIETAAVAVGGKLFGNSTGTITVNGDIAVKGTADMLFGNVAGGSVTVDGNISVDKATTHNGKIFSDVNSTVEVKGKITTGDLSGQIFGAIALDSNETVTVNGITVDDIAAGKSVIAGISGAGTINTGNVTVGNVNGQVFGLISGGELKVGELSTQAVGTEAAPAMIFGGISGGNGVTATSITAGNVYGQVFGDVDAEVVVGTVDTSGEEVVIIGGPITTGAIIGYTTADGVKVNGQVFGTVNSNVTTGAITVNGTVDRIFGDVKAAVTVDGTITAGKTDMFFGDVEATVRVNGLMSTGNLTGNAIGAVSADMTLSGMDLGALTGTNSAIASITDGTVKTGDVTVTTVAKEVFGPISGGKLEVGALSTEKVGTEATPARVFGEITNGNGVVVTSITTNGNTVYGQVFGDVGATVVVGTVDQYENITGGPITTGAIIGGTTADNVKVNGQVFGDVSANVTTGAITVEGNTNRIFGDVGANVTTGSITAGIVSGDMIGDIAQGAKVTTGAIEVASLNGLLAGEVNGTLQGNETAVVTINRGSNALGNLVTSVSGTLKNYSVGSVNSINESVIPSVTGTVQNFTVTSTGNMSAPLVGGELSGNLDGVTVNVAEANVGSNNGVLVNSVGTNATVIGCTVEATTVSSGAAIFGGLTGTNAGRLTNNMVTIGNLAADSRNTTVGGLVGVNTGNIYALDSKGNATKDNTQVTVKITYTPGDNVTIGGLIGENSGVVNGTTVTGEIVLNGAIDSSKTYIIGGSVGKDTGSSENPATYDNMTAEVILDNTSWAGVGKLKDAYGNSPVGMFVGLVTNGKFTACGSTEQTNQTYEFLGQIQYTTAQLPSGKYFAHASYTDEKYEYEGTNLDAQAENNQFVTVSERVTFSATLNNCTFYQLAKQYKQVLNTKNIYSGTTETREGGQKLTPAVMDYTYTQSTPQYSNLASRETNGAVETSYYAIMGGKYQKVYVQATFDWNTWEYVYTFQTQNGTSLAEPQRVSYRNTGSQIPESVLKLYTQSSSKVLSSDAEYIITNAKIEPGKTTYYFNGTSTGVKLTFNEQGNATNTNLTKWTIDNKNGYWKSGDAYLYMQRDSYNLTRYRGSKIVVTETSDGFALSCEVNNGPYLKATTGRNSATFEKDKNAQTIMLYTVEEVPDQNFCVFTLYIPNGSTVTTQSCDKVALQ